MPRMTCGPPPMRSRTYSAMTARNRSGSVSSARRWRAMRARTTCDASIGETRRFAYEQRGGVIRDLQLARQQ
jgi:hypothetical protein